MDYKNFRETFIWEDKWEEQWTNFLYRGWAIIVFYQWQGCFYSMIWRVSEPICTQSTDVSVCTQHNIYAMGNGCNHLCCGNLFWNLWSMGSLCSQQHQHVILLCCLLDICMCYCYWQPRDVLSRSHSLSFLEYRHALILLCCPCLLLSSFSPWLVLLSADSVLSL